MSNTNKTNSEEMENLARDAMQEDGPAIGTYAFTAMVCAKMFPNDGFDWDAWKDEMKDAM